MIRDNASEWGVVASQYIVRVQDDWGNQGLKVYIRPSDRGGETFDFIISGNDIIFANTKDELKASKRTKTIDKMLDE